MAKITPLTLAEATHYTLKVYSNRLKKLTRSCPDDGQLMYATGFMYLANVGEVWYVEYICSKDNEVYLNRTRQVEAIASQIAKEVLEADEDNES